MGSKKQAVLQWTGENLNLHAALGTGYEFEMHGPPDEGGGSPMEFLLAAAAGCTAMDVIHILKRKRQQISDVRVEIVGEQDDQHPKVYTRSKIVYVVRGVNIDPAAVERAIDLSQARYCSGSIMLKRAGMELETDYRIEEA